MGKRRILTAKGPHEGLQTARFVVAREVALAQSKLFYREAAIGAPLIMIHGLGASSRWWFPLFPELTDAGFRLLAPDLPGFGHSPGSVGTIEETARTVIAFADRLRLGEFFLCGHSMGGAIAAHLTANYSGRVRRLVLIDSAGIPNGSPARWLGRIVQPWSWCPRSFYGTLLGDIVRAGPRGMLRGFRRTLHYDLRSTLPHVRAPTLVIWGEEDTLTPLRHGHEIVDALPDGRLEVIGGARHLPMVSRPSSVAKLMIGFYKEFFGKDR